MDDRFHPDYHFNILCDPYVAFNCPIQGDCPPFDGESSDKPRTGEQSAQVSQASDLNAWHSRIILFSVPLAL